MSESTTVVDTDSFKEIKNLRDLIDRTNKEKPKPADVQELRRVLADSPKLWRVAGNMATLASEAAVNRWNATPFVKESVKRGMEVLRDDLGFADAPPLEKLLIEQVVLCWVNLHMLELVHNDRLAENHTTEAGLYWDRRLSTAQRRFVRATESLARVRKLTSATRLQDARTEATSAAKTVNNMRTLKALTA
jgi:hypothetical protein